MTRRPKVGHSIKLNTSKRRVTAMDQIIGTRLRARRLEMHLSQEALGQQLDLTFQQIQKYEKGANRIGSARLVEIAKILKVDTAYFLSDLSSTNGKQPITTASKFVEFMATTDGVAINEAMMRLSEHHRRGVIDLARTLVRAYGD